MLFIRELLELSANLKEIVFNYSSEILACALLILGAIIGWIIEFRRINDEKLKPKKSRRYKFLVGLTALIIIIGAIVQAETSISSDKNANYYRSQVEDRDSVLRAKTDTIKRLSIRLVDSISAYHHVYTDIFNHEMCKGCFPILLFKGRVHKMGLPQGYRSEFYSVYRMDFFIVNKGDYPMREVVVSFKEFDAMIEIDPVKANLLKSSGITPQTNRGEFRKFEIGYLPPNYLDSFYSVPLSIGEVDAGIIYRYKLKISWQSDMIEYTVGIKKSDDSQVGLEIVDIIVDNATNKELRNYYKGYENYIRFE